MSRNAYLYEERIYYDKSKPTVHFGWHISNLSIDCQYAHLSAPHQIEEMLQSVRVACSKYRADFTREDLRVLTAALYISRCASGEVAEVAQEIERQEFSAWFRKDIPELQDALEHILDDYE